VKNTYFIFCTLIIGCGFAGCSKVEPIYNVDHHALPADTSRLTESEIGQVIQETAEKRNWKCQKVSPTKINCLYQRNMYQAKVEINYSRYDFSIHEINSSNLKQNEKGEIHKKYNKWIKTLENDIVKQLDAHGFQK
jgi:hypothetical protein